MKALVLGYGSIGKRRRRQLTSLGHDVVVYDPFVAALVPVGTSEEEAWDWKPDVAVICTPASEHLRQMKTASQQEIPFFVEKPLALDSQIVEARSFVKACQWTGQMAAVGYNLRRQYGVCHLKENLYRLGAPVAATFTMCCDKKSWPGTTYADMLLEASHEIDLALYLLGPATVVSAIGGGECWTLLLQHESGCVSMVILNGSALRYYRSARIVGRDSYLEWRWWADRPKGEWLIEGVVTRVGTQTADETLDIDFGSFVRDLFDGVCPPCGLSDGVAALEICAAARKHVAGATLDRMKY